MQIHPLGSLHLRDIISIHRPAAEADLIILSLRATVWPRKTMPTKPLRNLLESCEHTGPRANRQEIFSARGGLRLKRTLHASFLHIRDSEARSVILVTRSSDAANSDNAQNPSTSVMAILGQLTGGCILARACGSAMEYSSDNPR
jgi:hypothetical protein